MHAKKGGVLKVVTCWHYQEEPASVLSLPHSPLQAVCKFVLFLFWGWQVASFSHSLVHACYLSLSTPVISYFSLS